MKLIIGLGNPGEKYIKTRHNMGFMAVDRLQKDWGFPEFKPDKKHTAEVSEGVLNGEKILLVKPQTYMNLSGHATQLLMNFYKVTTANIVVLYDDVAIALGNIRVRPDGSAGGHNGIKSIIASLGTQDFTRVRLGIAPLKPYPGALEDFVLGGITSKEKPFINQVLEKIPSLIASLLSEGIEKAMGKYN